MHKYALNFQLGTEPRPSHEDPKLSDSARPEARPRRADAPRRRVWFGQGLIFGPLDQERSRAFDCRKFINAGLLACSSLMTIRQLSPCREKAMPCSAIISQIRS